MKKLFRVSLFLFFCMMFVSSAIADVPKILSFQGRITDNSGVPITTDNAFFKFTFHTQASGGSQVGTDILLNNKRVDNGIYTVNIDIGGQSAILAALNQQLYIEVGFKEKSTDDYEIFGRTPLTSSLYAMSVANGSITPEKIVSNSLENPFQIFVASAAMAKAVESGVTVSTAQWAINTVTAYNLRTGVVTTGTTTWSSGSTIANTANIADGLRTGVVTTGTTTWASGANIAHNLRSGVVTTGTTTWSTNSGTSTWVTNSGTSTWATNAGTSTWSANAGFADVANSLSGPVSSATWATNSGTSTWATESATSTFAQRAASAYDDVFSIGTSSISWDNVNLRIKVEGNLHVAGQIYSTNTVIIEPADLAEIYPSNDILNPGDVVVISDTRDGYIEKSKTANDTKVAGVISTEPGILLNASEKGYKLALVGKVPVNVTNEGGDIKRGDLLVASSTPGYAMKAVDPKPGTIIGKALENYMGSRGKILALVNIQ